MDYKDAPPLMKKAIDKYYKMEYKKAIEYFQKSSEQENIGKYIGEIYIKKIECYLNLKKIYEVKEEYYKFSSKCSLDKYFENYIQIVELFRSSRLVPFALSIVKNLMSKISISNPELTVEYAKCLFSLNRLKEAEQQIEEALKILKLYESEFGWNFLLSYFQIKNSVKKYTDIIHLYYQYKSSNIKERMILFHPQIFLLVGIAFIHLKRLSELNNEIMSFFSKTYNRSQSTCYKTYLQSYEKLCEHNSIEGNKIFSNIIDRIEFHRINKDIFEEDISLFFELKGDLLDKITLRCPDAIENYYLCIKYNTESIVRIYNKLAISFLHDFEDIRQERVMSKRNKKISAKTFIEEVEELYRENQSNNNCYNLCLLEAYLQKIKKTFQYDKFVDFKRIIENAEIELKHNKLTYLELLNILDLYCWNLRLLNSNFINQFYLFPNVIYSKGKYAQIYTGEQTNELAAVKLYKINTNNLEREHNKIETALKEIITIQKINEYLMSADQQFKENNSYLLPIKSAIVQNNSKFIYLITPLYSGGNLYNLVINQKITLNLKQLKNVLLSIAKAIYVLHLLNMVHKDIQGKNIYIKEPYQSDANMQVCLGGFDMIGKNDINNLYNEISYNICAPELFEKSNLNNIGKEVDIYSFGMLIWEICVKEIPYEGFPKEEIIKQRSKNIELDYNKLKECTSENICHLFNKCTNKEPSQRPTIKQVVNYLNNIST